MSGKREKAKAPILQSYVASLLSLVLCCAMFLSATMAWFTNEVSTYGNQIYVGTLDVDLQNTAGTSLHGQNGTLFTRILHQDGSEGVTEVSAWQSGDVSVEELWVVNEGTIDFNYALYFALGTTTAGTPPTSLTPAQINAVTDQFEVWVQPITSPETAIIPASATAPALTMPDFTAAGSGWTQVKTADNKTTLTDLLQTVTTSLDNGTATVTYSTPIFQGTMTSTEITAASAATPAKHGYRVALKMKDPSPTAVYVTEGSTDPAAAIMGQTISLNVTLVASQQVSSATPPAGETTTPTT